jgi:predicted Fe-S protein YdhL (DUF1289 family)
MKNKSKEVPNPCVQICTMDPDSGLCIGCSRTPEEIIDWPTMTNEQRKEVVSQLPKR